VRFAHAMAVMCGASLVERFEITPGDVCYLSMPLFHSNGVAVGWAVAINSGAAMVPVKFSLSRFLTDIRRYRVTYMNYVAKPLALPLATPERPDDTDNALRAVFGNEATDRDIARIRTAFRVPGGGQLRVQRVRGRGDAGGRHPAGFDREGLSGCQRVPPGDRDRVCASDFRRARRARQLRRSGRRTGQHLRCGWVHRLLQRSRRHRRADARSRRAMPLRLEATTRYRILKEGILATCHQAREVSAAADLVVVRLAGVSRVDFVIKLA
jgi:AMP-binding enzyme